MSPDNNNASSDNEEQHWKYGLFYHNSEDPRLFLPKRNPAFGWTLNFARTEAYAILGVLLAIGVAGMSMRKHKR